MMAGLLKDPNAIDQPDPAGGTPPADPNAAPADPNAGDTVPDDQGEQASPEEQAAYEEFVKTGYGLMYAGGKVNPGVIKMLDDDPTDLIQALGNADEFKQFSPIVALAATAAIITIKTCEKTGQKDGTIILHGGKAILEDLVEVAGKAGIRDYSEQEMGQAFHMGADLFRQAAEAKGLVNMDQAKEDWSTITAADKVGKLGDVIPQFKGLPTDQQPQDQAGGANAA